MTVADYDPPRGAAPAARPGMLWEMEHRGDASRSRRSAQGELSTDVADRARFTKTLFWVGLTAVTALIAIRLALGPEAIEPVALAVRACFALSLMVGALLLFARWRFLEDTPAGWLAFSLLTLGIYLHAQLYLPVDAATWQSRLSLGDLLMMAVIVVATRAARAENAPKGGLNPLLLGLVCGLVLSGVRLLLDKHTPPIPDAILLSVVVAGFVISVLLSAGAIVRNQWLPKPWRWHLVPPVVIGIASHNLLTGTQNPLALPPIVGAALTLLASLQVLATTTALVHHAHQKQKRRLAELSARVEQAEDTIEQDEELLHEARATVAGMNSASQLLTSSAHRLSQSQVGELQTMLWAEIRRLQTLLENQPDVGVDDWFAIDDVLRPLVASMRAQGVPIQFRPSELRVWGDQETVTTAVHVLLCNAKRHAPGAQIILWAARRDDAVALHVADDGPGLPPEVSSIVFSRGTRGLDSPGQGLGLYSARKRLRAHGGDLDLVPSHRGARFAVTLPLGAACSE